MKNNWLISILISAIIHRTTKSTMPSSGPQPLQRPPVQSSSVQSSTVQNPIILSPYYNIAIAPPSPIWPESPTYSPLSPEYVSEDEDQDYPSLISGYTTVDEPQNQQAETRKRSRPTKEGGEEQELDEPVDDLGLVITDAKRDYDTEKERLQFEQML